MSSSGIPRRCMVLGIQPRNPTPEAVLALWEVVTAVRLPEHPSLTWHASKPAPAECEDGATLLVSCSASEASCAHPAFERALLDAVEACGAAGAEVWITAPCLVPLQTLSLQDLSVSLPPAPHSDRGGAGTVLAAGASTDLAVGMGTDLAVGMGTDLAVGMGTDLAVGMSTDLAAGATTDLAVRTGTVLAAGARLMRESGMVVLPGAVPERMLEGLRERVALRIRDAEALLRSNHPHIRIGEDLFAFQELSSRGEQRFDLLFPNEAGQEAGGDVLWLAEHGVWVPLVHGVLGTEKPHVQVSVVYSRPGAGNQDWHTDGAHVDSLREWGGGAAQNPPPYALCVFLSLIDLDKDTGCTQFWPGTHTDKGLAGFGPASEVLGTAVSPYVTAGGAVIYDYRLMHRGLANRSRERPILQFLYHLPSYQEKKNYGAASLFETSGTIA